MLRYALVLSLAATTLCAAARAATWTIRADGSGDRPTIQDGLEAASNGDTILVAAGTYTWQNQGAAARPHAFRGMIQLYRGLANDLVIRGESGPASTILNAQSKGRVFYTSGDVISGDEVAMRFTLEGFTLQNGRPVGGDPVTNQFGGGVATHLATPTIRDCWFFNNRTDSEGGAIWLGGQNLALIEDCVFRGNISAFGGAVFAGGSQYQETIRNCVFEANSATVGGGGAFYSLLTPVTLENCVFIANGSVGGGSAIKARFSKPLIVRDCFIYGGRGGVTAIDADWSAGGPWPSTEIEIHNSLIAYNDDQGIRLDPGVEATVSCTNVFGHAGGSWIGNAAALVGHAGNRNANPQFCSAVPIDRLVCDRSLLLDAHNGNCAGDIGMQSAGCSGCATTESDAPGEILSVLANPARGSLQMQLALRSDAAYSLRVFDLAGRLVAVLHDGPGSTSPQELSWDGLDRSGTRVHSGVYLLELRQGDARAQRRFTLLR